ncbi:MAG: hypothetical protein ACFFFB_23730 [Candidatus Heimdallarchaeota archaeon]
MNNQRLLNFITIIAVPFFILGLIVSLLFASLFGNFDINIHPISDLGSINRSPFPVFMNGTLILTSIVLAFFFFKLYIIVKKNIRVSSSKFRILYHYSSYFGFLLIIIMLISLFITGIINVDISREFHNICTIFVFIPLIFGEIIIGALLFVLNIVKKYISILMAFGHLLVSLLYFFIHTPLLEWFFFLILITWALPLSLKISKF